MTFGPNARFFSFSIVFLSVLIPFSIQCQNLPSERVTEWHLAGNIGVHAPENMVSITSFGADNTGDLSCNSAFSAAVASLNGTAGTVYFPAGEYFFDSAIALPDSIFLKGESAQTTLRFDLEGAGNLIVINGSMTSQTLELTANAVKGTYEIEIDDASTLSSGDVIRLYQFDEDLMYSTWAYGTLGQVAVIEEVDGNTITLSDPLNHNYPLSRTPYIRKLNPRKAAGIECLRIEREDATEAQTSNIYIGNAVNCVVRHVESEKCNFGHIEVNSSAHIQIEGCFFDDAFAHGGGGQGYGVVFQVASSFCKAENNVFDHLRHSMLLQSGANGNVFACNYSHNPFWEEGFLPFDAAGDAVLHGNYTYLNLFEGNTIQNIVVDASHGKNGPFNTFFRNRAEKYGFFSDSGTPTDSMNVVGNEITSSGFPYGLFMINGDGHFSYGNNVFGTIQPSGTTDMNLVSFLYTGEAPDYLNTLSVPAIGLPLSMNEQLLPAEVRFDQNEPIVCEQIITDSPSPNHAKALAFVHGDQLRINHGMLPATVNVYTVEGRLIYNFGSNSEWVSLSRLKSNMHYIIHIIGTDGTGTSFRTTMP